MNEFETMPVYENRRKKKGRILPFILGFILGCVIAGGVAFYIIGVRGVGMLEAQDPGSDKGTAVNLETVFKLQGLESAIDNYYYKADEVTRTQKEEGLYKGLLESLNDPYSVYFTKEEADALSLEISGTFYGIGAYLSMDPDTEMPKISGVKKSSPAEQAGLMANDIILKVDGESTQGMTLDEVVSHVRGEKGTNVTLTIVREYETKDVEMTRAEVADTVVYSSLIKDHDDIGYIQITEFDTVATEEFREEWENLREQGIKALILDLRDNPGGNVDTVTEIADWFLPEGLVFYMEDAKGVRTEYKCSGENLIDLPLVVLVNENSASAAEILSGGIKDAGTGTLIGKTTFGKGVVQSVLTLGDGSAVKITIADYYTRNGNNINKQGVAPDIEQELDIPRYLEEGIDSQLEKAIQELEKQLK